MYDEELDMALESTYDDGYTQALMDMGYYDDDIADESAYDEGYYQAMADMGYDYDEAMEGPAREYRRRANAGRSADDLHVERLANRWGNSDPSEDRHSKDPQRRLWREYDLSRRGVPGKANRYSPAMISSHKAYKNASTELDYRDAIGDKSYGRKAEGLYHRSR